MRRTGILGNPPRETKKRVSYLITLLFIGVIFSSCEYDQILPTEVVIPVDSVSYAADIQPFFDDKCISCHAGSISPNLSHPVSYAELSTNNWIDTDSPENSPLYQSVAPGGSMEVYATPRERALLLLWIEQGANNN